MKNVSIIIPYYKKRKFIKKTIDSIKLQSYRNFEVIIIYDDEDRSDLDFINKIIKNDNRMRLIINKKSLGAGRSRNIGISKAKGSIIAFLDADDLWKKNKIKSQLQFMKKNNFYISHTNYEIINENNKKIGLMKVKNELKYQNLIYSCDIGLSTVMVNSKLKNELKFPDMKTKEDYVLWLKLSKKNKIYGLQKNLVLWRKNKSSLSYTLQKIKDAFTVYSKFQKFNLIKSFIFVIFLSINFLKKVSEQKI